MLATQKYSNADILHGLQTINNIDGAFQLGGEEWNVAP